MKFSLITLLFILSSTAFAQGNLQKQLKTGLRFVESGASRGPNANQCDDEDKTPLSPKFSENGADCSNFIQANGDLGSLGRVIVSHLHTIDDPLFFSRTHAGIQASCPNWPRMTRAQKEYYWVWLLASIAWKESTCGAATFNRAATHGTAAGLLQLNKARKDRAWRGGESGESCKVNDIVPDVNNVKCGIEILHEQLRGKDGLYEGNGNIFGRGANSYWQDLRSRDGGKVIDLMDEFPHCN